MRSILTVLGITIGIAAVICVVAIGKAGQARVEQQLNNLGDNFVWIEAGGRAVNGVRTGTHDTKTLVMADAVAIKNQISLIKSVSPNVDDPVQVIYGDQNWHTSYRGVSPEYFEIKRSEEHTSELQSRQYLVCRLLLEKKKKKKTKETHDQHIKEYLNNQL